MVRDIPAEIAHIMLGSSRRWRVTTVLAGVRSLQAMTRVVRVSL